MLSDSFVKTRSAVFVLGDYIGTFIKTHDTASCLEVDNMPKQRERKIIKNDETSIEPIVDTSFSYENLIHKRQT